MSRRPKSRKLRRAPRSGRSPRLRPLNIVCAEYVDREQIVARLEVLREKADRIVRFESSGDITVLDEKQQEILAVHGSVRLCGAIFRTLRMTIDVLDERLADLEQVTA